MERIEINVQTGVTSVVPFTQEEIDYYNSPEQVAERAAQEAAIALAQDDLTAVEMAKANPFIQYLATHTPEECATFVQAYAVDQATISTTLQAMAMCLCIIARSEFRD